MTRRRVRLRSFARHLRTLVLLAVSVVLPASAQSFEERWKARVAEYEAENQALPAGESRIVLFGSSSMEGWKQGDRVKRYLPTVGPRTLNRGIGGDGIGIELGTAKGLRNRLESSVFNCQPSHVFVLNGRNSIGYGAERVAEAYEALLREIRERMPHVVVTVITCAPVNYGHADKKDAVVDLNTRLKAIAKATGCRLIDLHSMLVGPDGLMREELTQDGLHFKNKGYELLGREIERVVAETPPAPRQGGLQGKLDKE
ncbi:MAG: GDSL-type esterase/lipase family protein [Planctomycetota bacterium]